MKTTKDAKISVVKPVQTILANWFARRRTMKRIARNQKELDYSLREIEIQKKNVRDITAQLDDDHRLLSEQEARDRHILQTIANPSARATSRDDSYEVILHGSAV